MTMKALFHPCYFGSIAQYVAMAQSDRIIFETQDNYQKQTYRSRMFIYGANGKLLLNVPIKHHKTKDGRRAYKELKIENDFDWQIQHLRSLTSAYRTSPFFEYYEDELLPLFQEKQEYLLDFNLKCFEVIADCIQLDSDFEKTTEFEKSPKDTNDFRFLVNAKAKQPDISPYTQVFEEKHGFINNLSILDLLFNEGPNTLNYLEREALSV